MVPTSLLAVAIAAVIALLGVCAHLQGKVRTLRVDVAVAARASDEAVKASMRCCGINEDVVATLLANGVVPTREMLINAQSTPAPAPRLQPVSPSSSPSRR